MKRRILALAAAGLLLAACDSGTTGTPDNHAITISLASAAAEIQQGGTLDVQVSVARLGGFSGPVTLSAEGLPAGVTAASTTVAAGASSGTVTLTADGAAAPTSATVTIRGVGTGVTAVTAQLALSLAVRGSYTLSAQPAALPLTQGATGESTIGINRAGGFTGTVTLAANAPAGITATLTPSSVTGTAATATLALAAAASVAPGNYTVTVTGTTPGLANQTATVTVTVSAAGSFTLGITPGTVSLAAGAQTTAEIAITRLNGFAGAVGLSASAPAGITATVEPASAAGAAATLTVAAGAAVEPGGYTVTVNGTAAGVTAQTATLAVQVTAAGSFSIAVDPASLDIAPGSTGAATVNVTRDGGFTGAVTITAEAGTGVVATVATPEVTGASTQLSVAVDAATAAGSYTVTVRGNAAGLAEQTAQLAVTVTAAGSFSIALNPTALTVQQGASGTSQVTVTRTGAFAGDVTLSASTAAGLPPGVAAATGVTVTFDPAVLTGSVTQSTMTVSAAAAATVGTSQVTVRASATGQPEQTAGLALTVNESQVGGGNVTWTFCGFSGMPQFVAAQDGDGAWTRVNGNAANEYSFQISSGRGGVAWVVPADGGGWDMQMFFGTTAELQAQGVNICWGTTGPGKTITGTVTPAPAATQQAFITLGRTQAQVLGGGSAFTLARVMDGPLDLVAVRTSLNFATFALEPDRVLIQRNVNLADNASLGALNLEGGAAPASAAVTFENLMGDWSGTVGLFLTERNTQAFLYADVGITATATRQWYGVPASLRTGGDLHVVNAIGLEPVTTGSPVSQTRQVMFVTANVAARTVQLGPRHTAPNVSVTATAPYARLRLDHTVAEPYHRYFIGNFQQGDGDSQRIATAQQTSAYLDAGGAPRLEIPDLSALTGWNNDWGLKTGVLTTWTQTATGWNGAGILGPVLVEGATLMSGTRMGQITP